MYAYAKMSLFIHIPSKYPGALEDAKILSASFAKKWNTFVLFPLTKPDRLSLIDHKNFERF